MIGGDKFLLNEEGKSEGKKWRNLFYVLFLFTTNSSLVHSEGYIPGRTCDGEENVGPFSLEKLVAELMECFVSELSIEHEEN